MGIRPSRLPWPSPEGTEEHLTPREGSLSTYTHLSYTMRSDQDMQERCALCPRDAGSEDQQTKLPPGAEQGVSLGLRNLDEGGI